MADAIVELIERLITVRVPAWPVTQAIALLETDTWPSELASLNVRSRLFREALLYASSGLRFADNTDTAGSPASLKRLFYAVRMGFRCTPFGLFASTGLAEFDNTAERHVNRISERHAHIQPSFEAITSAFEFQLQKAVSERTGAVQVVRSNLVFLISERYVLLDERKTVRSESSERYKKVSIAARKPIISVLEAASSPITLAQLITRLSSLPGATEDGSWRLLTRLLNERFLVPRSLPLPDVGYLSRLRSYVQTETWLDPLIKAFEEATARNLPINVALDSIDASTQALRTLTDKTPEYGFSKIDITHNTIALPTSIKDDLSKLTRLLTLWGHKQRSGSIRELFMQRYESEERLVPLLDIITIADYEVPLEATSETNSSKDVQVAFERFRTQIAASISLALAEKQSVAHVELDVLLSLPIPEIPAFDIAFEVISSSYGAIANNDYSLVLSPLGASAHAGQIFGRFAQYFDCAVAEWRRICARQSDEHTILVEPIFTPSDARFGNVLQDALAVDTLLTLPVDATASNYMRLTVLDIFVGILHGDLGLYNKMGKNIKICWPTAFNVALAPPLVRFLYLISNDGDICPGTLQLGDLSKLSYLPRLVSGRLILRRASWLVPIKCIRLRFIEYAREHLISNYVTFAERDNVILIDTRSSAGASLLISCVSKLDVDDYATLSEALVGEESLWLRDPDDARYRAEFVCTVGGNTPVKQGATTRSAYVPRHAEHQAATEWIYLKLYGFKGDFRAEFADRLSQFIKTHSDSIQAWFFVLYADPIPHFRLRMNSAGPQLHGQIRAFVLEAQACGLFDKFVVESYEPEFERYGGPNLIKYSETIFEIDSIAALNNARTYPKKEDELYYRTARDAGYFLRALLHETEFDCWMQRNRPKRSAARQFESGIVKANIRTFNEDVSEPSRRLMIAGRYVAEHSSLAAYVAIVDSLLHMHFNRRGLDHNHETFVRRLLWKTLFSSRHVR